MGFFRMKCSNPECGKIAEVFQRWTIDPETRETVRNFQLDEITCGHEECFDPDDYSVAGEDFVGCGAQMFRTFEGGSFSISSKGLNGDHQGFYSPDLGRRFNNKYEAYEYAEQNGFKPLSKVNEDDVLQRGYDLEKQDAADMKKIKELQAAGKSKEEAYGETFSVNTLKERGMLDSSIKSGE